MGFLSRENVEKIRGEEHEAKMEEWRYNYPFTAVIMAGQKPTDKQALDLVRLGEQRRSNS